MVHPKEDSHQTAGSAAERKVRKLQEQIGQERDGIAQPGALNGFHQSDLEPENSRADRCSDSGLKQAGGAGPRKYQCGWRGSGLTEAGTSGQEPRQRCQGWSQTGRSGQSLANLGSSRWTELCRVPTTALRTVQQSHLKKWLSALQAWTTVERAGPSS